jgi:hypothetical protein
MRNSKCHTPIPPSKTSKAAAVATNKSESLNDLSRRQRKQLCTANVSIKRLNLFSLGADSLLISNVTEEFWSTSEI